MPRFRPDSLKERAEFGIDMAAKLTGYPEHNLRIDFDRNLIQGVRRTPGGKRLISREGLRTYLQAKGWDPKALTRIERRGAERISRAKPKAVHLEIVGAGPGEGTGVIADLSFSGFQAKNLSWAGCLPGPETEVRFRILSGELKGTGGEARISWIDLRGGALRMGFEAKPRSGSRRRWVAFLNKGIETRRRQDRRVMEKARPFFPAESNRLQ